MTTNDGNVLPPFILLKVTSLPSGRFFFDSSIWSLAKSKGYWYERRKILLVCYGIYEIYAIYEIIDLQTPNIQQRLLQYR